jgi:hypothetical protein
MKFRGGKIQLMRECFNPIPFAKAVGPQYTETLANSYEARA